MGDRDESSSAYPIETISKTLHDNLDLPGSHNDIDANQYPDHGAEPELHVVMMPYPLQGHINPMMQLAKLLISHSYLSRVRVTFVNNRYNYDRIQSTRSAAYSTVPTNTPSSRTACGGCGALTCTGEEASSNLKQQQDLNRQLQLVWVDNGLPLDFDYSDLWSRMAEFHLATYNMKDPLKQLLQNLNKKEGSPPVSCVVFGSFCPWAHGVAAELGIPSFLFWTQSTAVFSMYYHAPLLDANGFFPFNKKSPSGCNEEDKKQCDTTDQELVSYIPGVPPLHRTSFPTMLHVDSPSDPSLASVNEQAAMLGNCSGMIINSFEELEGEAYQALQERIPCPLFLVGPLIPSAFLNGGDVTDTSIGASLLQERKECIQWLDSQEVRSVLYISFGSVFGLAAEDRDSIACAIQGRKQPFLWVIRSRSSLDSPDDLLPKGFREDTKDYGLIIPWAPQVQVLSHSSIGAFLTHCGWNSTIESVSMAVPMIPFTFISDQPTNCTYVCDIWKIGMALKRQEDGKVKHEDIEGVLRVLFKEEEGEEMRRRASKLREAARRAVQAEGSSSTHIERLMETMRNQSECS